MLFGLLRLQSRVHHTMSKKLVRLLIRMQTLAFDVQSTYQQSHGRCVKSCDYSVQKCFASIKVKSKFPFLEKFAERKHHSKREQLAGNVLLYIIFQKCTQISQSLQIVSQILVLVFNCNFFWLQWLLNPNNNNILEICVIFLNVRSCVLLSVWQQQVYHSIFNLSIFFLPSGLCCMFMLTK